MKKCLLIFFIICSYSSKGQDKQIESFLGIKFGSTKVEVLKIMTARGSILDLKESTSDIQLYKNVKLGVRKVDGFSVRFIDDKVFQADFLFLPPLESQAIDYYKDVVQDITNFYGVGQFTKNFNEKLMDDGGSNAIYAIKKSEATYVTYWTQKNTIAAKIIPTAIGGVGILLVYEDSELAKTAIEKQKSDY